MGAQPGGPGILPGGVAYSSDVTVKTWPHPNVVGVGSHEGLLLTLEVRGQRDSSAGLTDFEKPTQHTALSNTPRPSTCKVERETESQTRTWGGSGCKEERGLLPGGPSCLSPPPPRPSLQVSPPPICYLPLLRGACHLSGGNGDHIRVDSQAEREDRWTGLRGRRGAHGGPGPLPEQPKSQGLAIHSTSWLSELFRQPTSILSFR